MSSKVFAFFLGIFISANLLATVGFAATNPSSSTMSSCDQLLYDSKSGSYSIWKLQDKNFSDIVDCATPGAVKTQALSPLQILQVIIDAVVVLATLLSILGIVLGAINMATSSGEKAKFESGKSLIVNSFIALAITLTAYQILNLFINLIGFGI